jgi:hypothetical protein
MKSQTYIDVAVPIEYICMLLGLPEDTKGVYHSQKSNTLFIRVSQEDINNPCRSAVLKPVEDNSSTIDVNETTIRTYGPKYRRSLGWEFKVSRYIDGLSRIATGIIKVAHDKAEVTKWCGNPPPEQDSSEN